MSPFRIIMLFIALTHQCMAQSCLPAGITFTSQEQIDNFNTLYPNCTIIEGDVNIGDYSYPFSSTDIHDLSGLSSITQINGSLGIFYNSNLQNLNGLAALSYLAGSLSIDNNDLLRDLTGLNNLTSVNGNLTIKSNDELESLFGLENIVLVDNSLYVSSNPLLESFVGLKSLQTINGYFSIANNNSLSSFDGLNSLNFIINYIHIWNNDNLIHLQGLESLSEVGGFVSISNNESLQNIDGISNLQTIGSYLSIHDNAILNSIEGMSNITPESIKATSSSQNDLEIYNNTNLTSCALENICFVFNTVDSKILISSNGVNCVSEEDVYSICNPVCGVVNTTSNSGVGSLQYNLDCIAGNDTIFIDEALAGKTIWLSETTIDLAKNVIVQGPEERVMIATTLEAPLVDVGIDAYYHFINIDLYKFYPISDTLIYNQGTLILENCKLISGSHQFFQSENAQLIVRGNTEIIK